LYFPPFFFKGISEEIECDSGFSSLIEKDELSFQHCFNAPKSMLHSWIFVGYIANYLLNKKKKSLADLIFKPIFIVIFLPLPENKYI